MCLLKGKPLTDRLCDPNHALMVPMFKFLFVPHANAANRKHNDRKDGQDDQNSFSAENPLGH